VLHADPRLKRQEGERVVPLIQKDLAAAPGGHTKTMQQKARRGDATPDLFLKQLNIKTDETLEKNPFETLEKTPKNHCNHTQYPDKTHATSR
jgi:hypothetical protein